jgi:hypothetical protein
MLKKADQRERKCWLENISTRRLYNIKEKRFLIVRIYITGILIRKFCKCILILGTLLKESGGELVYILKSFQIFNKGVREILAFLYSWDEILFF